MSNKLKLTIIVGALLILIVLISIYYSFKEKMPEGLTNNTSVIPKNIFQTWKTLNLPPKMKECVEKLKRDNPEFTYYLFDDKMCVNFIKKHFDKSVLCAYNKIIPTAYKADLFRYCVLYKMGGIYLDIKYECIGDFRLTQLTNSEYFVKDIETSGGGIYNGFMVCKPKNKILHKAIYKIVDHANTGYYGLNSLSPTGPLLLKTYFSQDELYNLKLSLKISKNKQLYIYNEDKAIMVSYADYRVEQLKTETIPHYGILWNQKRIYNANMIC